MDGELKEQYKKRIGQGLAVAREEANLTQIEVGKTGIVRSNRLSQIELGKAPISTEEFLALCELYKTTPDIVLGIGPGKTAHITQLKIDNLLKDLSSNELEMVFYLLQEYKNKKKR